MKLDLEGRHAGRAYALLWFDEQTQRIRGEAFHVIGRMASPHGYCRTADRFEMKRPD